MLAFGTKKNAMFLPEMREHVAPIYGKCYCSIEEFSPRLCACATGKVVSMLLDELFLKTIFMHMPVGLAVMGEDGGIVTVNEAFERIFLMDAGQVTGKGWGELFLTDEKNPEFNQVILDTIARRANGIKREVPYFRDSGETLTLMLVSSYLERQGERAGMLVLIDDVTEIRKLADREKRLLAERAFLVREREEGVQKLAMCLAHQIRNPVLTIGGYANLLLRNADLAPSLRPRAEGILDGSMRLEELVKAVASFAALPSPSPLNVELESLLGSMISSVERYAAEQGKRLHVNNGSFPQCLLHVDPVLVQEALLFVGMNCVDFAKDDDVRVRVRYQFHEKKKQHVILFSDQGTGIASSDLPYIYDPFFTTKAQGVGMGLTSARRILREHGGELHVRSREGAGTFVAMHFPA